MNSERQVSKESVLSVIEDFTNSLKSHLCKKDADANALMGSKGHGSDGKYPIFSNSKFVGSAPGGEKACAAASFLSYLAVGKSEIPNIASYETSTEPECAKLRNDSKSCSDKLEETLNRMYPDTAGHTKRVRNYCMFLGRILELPETETRRLHLAAILHYIGQIRGRDDICCKKENLTEEYAEMKKLMLHGWEILRQIKIPEDVIPVARHHDEQYDGKRFPGRLMADEIDIIARIIAVSDAFIEKMSFIRHHTI